MCSGGGGFYGPDNSVIASFTDVCSQTSSYVWPQNANSNACIFNFPLRSAKFDSSDCPNTWATIGHRYTLSFLAQSAAFHASVPPSACECESGGSVPDKDACEGHVYRRTSASVESTWGYVIKNGQRVHMNGCGDAGEMCSGGGGFLGPANSGVISSFSDVCSQTSYHAWPQNEDGNSCIFKFPLRSAKFGAGDCPNTWLN